MYLSSLGSNTDDRIATIVLAKKMPDESGVYLDENLEEIRKLLRKRGFWGILDKQEQTRPVDVLYSDSSDYSTYDD